MKPYFFYAILISIILLAAGCSSDTADRMPEEDAEENQEMMQEPGDTASSNTAAFRSEMVSADSAIHESRRSAITRTVQEVSPAVVSITVTEVVEGGRSYSRFFDQMFIVPDREFSSIGSGFIISEDGLVVTNEHVAPADAKKIVISFQDSLQYEAEIIGSDELTDVSLLKIKADTTFPHIKFGNSDEVLVGEWSIAIGNPFGLFKTAQPSVTVGVVSAVDRDFRPNPNKPRVYLDMIQTDAAINSGNSGGPLVNSEGKVIGINTFIYTGGTSGGFVGLGFAIPSNRVRKIVGQLISSGEVQMSYDLGIETTPMTYQLVAQNNLPAVMGLFVSSVNRDGPAFESGIMPGDIIIKIGDERVQSQMHAQALFREYEAGETMRVELLREDSRYEADIDLRSKVRGD